MTRQPRHLLAALTLVLLAPSYALAGDAAPSWSPKAAAKYLDGRADHWLKWAGAARGQGTVCISCHTTLPFALARPTLGDRLGEIAAADVEQRLINNVKLRVENWAKIVADSNADKDPHAPYYAKDRRLASFGTESVLNALILTTHDAKRAKGVVGDATQKALGHLWEKQQANGAWLWLDFGLKPWEQKDSTYVGASLAALAVGTAGKDYHAQPDIQTKVAALKKYLKTEFAAQPLHHRVVALWASSRLPGILDNAEKEQLVKELKSMQETDGGWSLPKMGKAASVKEAWKSHGSYPEGTVSDGYATGLVILALKRTGIGVDDPHMKKALGWLVTHEKDGTWPAHYPNRPRDPQSHVGMFMHDAATAFAVLALCE